MNKCNRIRGFDLDIVHSHNEPRFLFQILDYGIYDYYYIIKCRKSISRLFDAMWIELCVDHRIFRNNGLW